MTRTVAHVFSDSAEPPPLACGKSTRKTTHRCSRFVCATGGVLLVLLGLFPKMSQVVAPVPQGVRGQSGSRRVMAGAAE